MGLALQIIQSDTFAESHNLIRIIWGVSGVYFLNFTLVWCDIARSYVVS